MITLAYKTGRYEDVGIGYDLASDRLMLWTESNDMKVEQSHREITLAEVAAEYPDLAAEVAGRLTKISGGKN